MNCKVINLFILLTLAFSFFCCSNKTKSNKLPVLGPFEKIESQKRYYPVPDFHLVNQEGDTITSKNFENSLRIVDFFFISCPTICPKVQAQMMRIYNAFKDEKEVQLISHSIDVKRDTVGRLARYAKKLNINNADQWQFVTGTKDDIFNLAGDYFNIVVEDKDVPEGFDHSGRIVLVDKEGYIRAFANGLDIESVDRLINNIGQLLKSYEKKSTE